MGKQRNIAVLQNKAKKNSEYGYWHTRLTEIQQLRILLSLCFFLWDFLKIENNDLLSEKPVDSENLMGKSDLLGIHIFQHYLQKDSW